MLVYSILNEIINVYQLTLNPSHSLNSIAHKRKERLIARGSDCSVSTQWMVNTVDDPCVAACLALLLVTLQVLWGM